MDPGGYKPWLKRFNKGLLGLFDTIFQSLSRILPVNKSGGKSGLLTTPSISPDSGMPT